jgi:hypothetical protein
MPRVRSCKAPQGRRSRLPNGTASQPNRHSTSARCWRTPTGGRCCGQAYLCPLGPTKGYTPGSRAEQPGCSQPTPRPAVRLATCRQRAGCRPTSHNQRQPLAGRLRGVGTARRGNRSLAARCAANPHERTGPREMPDGRLRALPPPTPAEPASSPLQGDAGQVPCWHEPVPSTKSVPIPGGYGANRHGNPDPRSRSQAKGSRASPRWHMPRGSCRPISPLPPRCWNGSHPCVCTHRAGMQRAGRIGRHRENNIANPNGTEAYGTSSPVPSCPRLWPRVNIHGPRVDKRKHHEGEMPCSIVHAALFGASTVWISPLELPSLQALRLQPAVLEGPLSQRGLWEAAPQNRRPARDGGTAAAQIGLRPAA